MSGVTNDDVARGLALQVIRAHRLLERYFADEARLPLRRLHAEAEWREHALSPADADRLSASLGPQERSSGSSATSMRVGRVSRSMLRTCLIPLGHAIGLDGVILLAYVIAIPANEIVVPTILMVCMGTGMMAIGALMPLGLAFLVTFVTATVWRVLG